MPVHTGGKVMAVRLVVMDHRRRGQAGHVAGSPDCGNVPASGAVDFGPLGRRFTRLAVHVGSIEVKLHNEPRRNIAQRASHRIKVGVMKDAIVIVNDKMQSGYRYQLSAETGTNFDPEFRPDLTPSELLSLGIFCGKYMTDCRGEFPPNWFEGAKLASGRRDCSLNYFGLDASQPLSVWRRKGWIYRDDPRGWFQWYCRYYMGRRLPEEDARQIKRWKAMRRHIGQVLRNCERGDLTCRRRQRQALLHWAYDSRKM
jgi:hypothetical protein